MTPALSAFTFTINLDDQSTYYIDLLKVLLKDLMTQL